MEVVTLLGVQFYNELGRHVRLWMNETYRWRANRQGQVFINDEPINAPGCARMVLKGFQVIEQKFQQAGVSITVEDIFGESTPSQVLGGPQGSGTVRFRMNGESKLRTLEMRGNKWYVGGQHVLP